MFAKDTILLQVQFRDFRGNKVTPGNVKLTIYDLQQTVIEEITSEISTDGNGRFEYEYTDTTGSDFIFEFSGVFNDGKPILARQEVKVKFN